MSTSNGKKAAPASVEPDVEPFPVCPIEELRGSKLTYLWPGRLAFGTVAMLEGAKGTGKSSIAAALAAHVAGGPRLEPGRKKKLGTVLWYPGEEDGYSMTLPKIRAAKCPPGRVLCPGYAPNGRLVRRLRLPGDVPVLRRSITDAKARLVVLDPWHSFLDPGISLFDTQLARAVVESLALIAADTGALILLTRNLRKDESGDMLSHGLGSVEIANVARSVLQTRPHPDQDGAFVLVVAALNATKPAHPLSYTLDGSKDAPCVRWGATLGVTAEEVVRADRDPGGRDERVDARSLLTRALAGGWKAAREILAEAQASGICPRTLRTAKAELGIPSRRVGDSGSGHWEWGRPTKGG